MAIQDLQRFLESQVPGACVPVDLLKIAKSVGIRRSNHRSAPRGLYGHVPLTLVVDGEYCLDRLYGGFFSGKTDLLSVFISFTSGTVVAA